MVDRREKREKLKNLPARKTAGRFLFLLRLQDGKPVRLRCEFDPE